MLVKPASGQPSSCEGVLIVDDEKDIRESIQAVMEFEGIRSRVAENGREALEALKGMPRPQLIFLDLMMPVMNGWEFAQAASQDKSLSDCPIVVISAFADKARDLPVAAFLKKPVNLDEMIRWTDHFVRKAAA